VSGQFTHIGTVPRPGLAHLRSSGRLDRAFAPKLPGVDSWVNTIAYHRGVVYAGGEFGVIALDARSGKRLWRASRDSWGSVSSLVFGNGVLYVGGDFAHIAGVSRDGIAALNPANGRPTPWQVVLSGGDPGGVGQFVLGNGQVYIAGDFTSVDGARREFGIAAVSPRTGRLTPWNPRLSPVLSFALSGGLITASDHKVFIANSNEISAFDSRTGRHQPWEPILRGGFSTYTVSGDTVYLGGAPAEGSGFDRAGGKPANDLASIVLPQGKSTNWRPDVAPFTNVYCLSVSGHRLLAGGKFYSSSSSSSIFF
jgi:outer membrane protein assembly factor BamB